MKLLIRTITLGAIFVFMITIIMNATIVENTKYELEVASTNSLYHTIDTFEKNRELMAKGSDNLYFSTDSEYYYYFLDDLLVQLNGNIKIDSVVNYINVDTGDLDIDITVTYKGLDKMERTHTVHVDTYGRINLDLQTTVAAQASKIEIGSKVKWAEQDWYVAKNEGENITLIYAGDIEKGTYGSTVNYVNSTVANKMAQFVQSKLDPRDDTVKTEGDTSYKTGGGKYSNLLNNAEIGNMNLLSGVYMKDGNDTLNANVYALSENEATALNEALNKFGYSLSDDYWLRTANSNDEVKVASTQGIVNAKINTSHGYRAAVSVNKNSLSSLDTETDSSNNIVYNLK